MKQILSFIKTYVIFVLLFVAQKPLFLLLEKSSTAAQTINIWDNMPRVIWHGLSLDLGMAGYLSVIPGLLLLASIWIRKKLVYPILNIYYGIVAFLGAFFFVLNLGLYPYWNFPLDSTPLFYFFTSPKDAIASVSFFYIFLAFLAVLVSAIGVWFILRVTIRKKPYHSRYMSYGTGSYRGGRRSLYDSDIERHRLRSSLILLVLIMESFANDIMPSMGKVKNVAVQLDSIAQKSILFTRFYANSFRTDRGLVSILSGYPAQPTMSIMRYPAKTAQLPSIARSLAKAKNYQNAYYYGGDVDFANQRSYLVSQGYQKIISDADFPIEDKLSKWGVHDHIVAEKLLEDLKKEQNVKHPMLRIFQTSSSHEPFDVPYSRLKDKRLNAFAYTDSVVGHLMREYSKLPRWKNTLVVLVPDHVGGYKEHLDNFDRSRYQIPLILAGGAIARPMKVALIGSQNDIAATLLGQLGVKHQDFLFSKNMMSDATPKFAFFDVPDAFGMVSEDNSIIYDNKAQKVVYDQGKKGHNLKRGQAYLQKLYDDIASKK